MTENEVAGQVVDVAFQIHQSRLGLLINFGSELIKDGISRVANGLVEGRELIP